MKQPPILPTIIGTGFGAGFWPWGPGTMGAIAATLIWFTLGYVLTTNMLTIVTLSLIVLMTLLGTWATKRLQPYWGDDPSNVVIDEMVGVWIPLLLASDPQMKVWWALTALLLFRLFDILKPLGIKSLDNRKGAIWVMLDDILAGLYAAIILGIIIIIYHGATT
ncbi:MAG: phosphatidylglycerophosphatase A [Prevotella sp.]|nr:phosphatidylglycerophosphatase A [Prevotella sp.]